MLYYLCFTVSVYYVPIKKVQEHEDFIPNAAYCIEVCTDDVCVMCWLMILTFRYAEFIIVPELKYLVKIPDSISLSVAAMLPTGALLAMNTVFKAHEYVQNILQERGDNGLFSESLNPTLYFIRLVSCLSSDCVCLVYHCSIIRENNFLSCVRFHGFNALRL